jgi:hypothetical protein
MDQLLVIALDDDNDSVAVFEVDSRLVRADLDLAAGDNGVIARARVSLEEALSQVRPTLAKIVHAVHGSGPDEIEIEFGLKVGGDSNVIIAKGTAEVNFAVRLTWKQA